MRFHDVAIAGLTYAEAPHRVPSAQFEARLAPTLARLGLPADAIRSQVGVQARRWWDAGTQPSEAATRAAQQLMRHTGLDPAHVGLLINTSVCRDYLEPSTASIVHGNLGLPSTCMSFDLGNACLGFLNGMGQAALLIERGAVDYALVVDGESSRDIQEATLARLSAPGVTRAQFEAEFATLTLGSGGAAMLLTRRALAPHAPRLMGGVNRAATQHAKLCWGQASQMQTHSRQLLFAGITLAKQTWAAAQAELGWTPAALDQLVLHQVSTVHTTTLCRTLGLDPDKALLTLPELGNVGPASVPITLHEAARAGRLNKGDRVALMGIGSGINVAMYEVEW